MAFERRLMVIVQAVFQQAHILVARAEERLDVGANPDAFLHSVSIIQCLPVNHLDPATPHILLLLRGHETWRCLLRDEHKTGLCSETGTTGMRMPRRQVTTIG